MSWAVPYIHSEITNITPACEGDFHDLINGYFRTLRDRVLQFANSYYNIGLLSQKERRSVLQQRSKAFVEHLRSPESQMLFSMGISKQEIADGINNKFSQQLNTILTKAPELERRKTVGRRARSKAISKARRDKMVLRDYDCNIEPQSALVVANVVAAHFLMCATKFVVSLAAVMSVWMLAESLRKTCKDAERIVSNVNKVTNFASAIASGNFNVAMLEAYDSDTRLFVTNCKSFLHLCYYLYMQKTSEALAWGSQFLFSTPELFFRFAELITQPLWTTVETVTHIPVDFMGSTYSLAGASWVRFREAYMRDDTVTMADIVASEPHNVVVESGDSSASWIKSAYSLFATWMPKGLSESQMRAANVELAYATSTLRS